MLNLDTHILIGFIRGELLPREKKIIEKNQDQLVISDIVLWEIAKLHSRKKIDLDVNAPEFKQLVSHLKVLPISAEIAAASVNLDFSFDPADELIAATSLVHRIPLLTRDQRMLKSKLIKFA